MGAEPRWRPGFTSPGVVCGERLVREGIGRRGNSRDTLSYNIIIFNNNYSFFKEIKKNLIERIR